MEPNQCQLRHVSLNTIIIVTNVEIKHRIEKRGQTVQY